MLENRDSVDCGVSDKLIHCFDCTFEQNMLENVLNRKHLC